MGWITIIIIAIVLFAVAFSVSKQKQEQLVDAGKIIPRDYGFEEYAEMFTLRDLSFSEIWNELKDIDYSGTVTGNVDAQNERVFYKGINWEACLYHQRNDAEKNVYCFEFTKWSKHNGVTENQLDMNIVLTAVEKAFLKLDSGTQVSKRKNITKSKLKFF